MGTKTNKLLAFVVCDSSNEGAFIGVVSSQEQAKRDAETWLRDHGYHGDDGFELYVVDFSTATKYEIVFDKTDFIERSKF